MTQKYQFIAAHTRAYPVTLLCRVLQVARSGYDAWRRQRPVRTHAHRDAQLLTQVQPMFQASRQTYGSPRVHAALQQQGQRCSRKQVARLMRRAGLVARVRRRRVCTTNSRQTDPVAPTILDRQFTVDAPHRAWVADIT